MADEDTTPNQPSEEEVVEDQSPDTPETPEQESEDTSTEESTEEAPDEAAEEQEETPEPEEEPEERPPSRREQLRVQDLLKKYGPPKPRQPQQQPQQRDAGPNYREMLEADEPVYEQLEQQSQQYGQQQYQQGQNEALQQMQTVEWRTMLHVDAPQTEAKHKFLNPQDKENFHPALADAINESYKQFVGYDEQTGLVANPNVRYSEFVDGYVEMASEIAREMNRTTTRNVTKQAARTGIRPDGSSARRLDLSKAPEDMSDDELNAYLSQAIPKK